MINATILYTLAIILTSISFIKDRNKTKDALFMSWKMFRNIIPEILSIMFFVGLSLSLLTPTIVSSIIGEQSGLKGIGISAIIGSFGLIPSFIVFPLGETLVNNGAGLPQVAVLMSTLMSVGIITLPMEQKLFGRSFAYARNASGLLMSLLFAYIIWVVML